MKNIFQEEGVESVKARIERLSANSQPQWGKMNVGQMLAHCNVTYEMVFDDIHPKPNGFVRFILKLFVKNKVVSEQTYSKNSQTAPQFIITDNKKFEFEKERLLRYIDRVFSLGEAHFEGKESHSFGPLSAKEWNNMFYKHLDHHLTQFGV